MRPNPLGHSARAAKGARKAFSKGKAAAKAGLPITACPYKDASTDPKHLNFGRKWKRKWVEGYKSVKKEEPLPP